ncbi:hypothetical protein QNI16_35955 [Cytophagaceae bacterium YF14B1]|uniref:Uncharacterized protein n=1 Tax=Xanthocytophaga flava TaxID=3048013 RepID=A0AAE3QV09_9BACT|nr:hypothetical protein [Xanthocytophaga flavus]MDJ1485932.1 hypothetical protein [Xanthocytophaga flavus]
MNPILPEGLTRPLISYSLLSKQNPSYARCLGITENDLENISDISTRLYEKALHTYHLFADYGNCGAISPIRSFDKFIQPGDRIILKGYNARYRQPVLYTNGHIEGYWATCRSDAAIDNQQLSVCVQPGLIRIGISHSTICCQALGENWLDVPASQIRYCGISKKFFLYQGENSCYSNYNTAYESFPSSELLYAKASHYTNHLLISGWVSVFEYENREKIF